VGEGRVSQSYDDRGLRAYEEVRAAVLRVKAHASASGRPPQGGPHTSGPLEGGSHTSTGLGLEALAKAAQPSDYWEEELAHIDYLIEASPLIVRKLRHHAYHITSIRAYDYRAQDDGRREGFAARLRALVELGGPELVVPEHEALGGFGHRLLWPVSTERPDAGEEAAASALFNVDTIKFLEVLVGMKRAGVLDSLRQRAAGGTRPTVVEIGAGWGGFAYQLMTLLPTTRYVIVDFPELFLFSATYLKTVFPNARVVILGQGGDHDDADAAAAAADIVFIPNAEADRVKALAPDLTVNMVSFQEMTSAQVRAYAALAHAAGCPRIYSLNRDRSRYNTQLSSVTEQLSPFYDLRDVPVLETSYMAAMRKPATPKKPKKMEKAEKADGVKPRVTPESDEFAYRHVVGERRDRVREDGPVVAIGATLFNRAEYLPRALDSILNQTYANFRLVLLDDGSSDETERIAREYAARDPRVTYIRHPTRQGMTATWRHAFEAATAADSVEYFAWASDHDVWDPRWLETLLGELRRHPEAVLAYPHTRRVDEQDRLLDKPTRLFHTAGMADLEARWRFVCSELVASGDMVYGVARVGAMKAAGVFRDVICPDRLLMAELALQGEFRMVPGELWFRRQFAGAVRGGAAGSSVERQRTSLFAGDGPSGRWLPPWLQHGRSLWRHYVTGEPDPVRRRAAARRTLRYVAVYALRHHQKSPTHKVMFGIYWTIRCAWKKAKHYVLLGVFYTLVYGRRAYHRTVYEAAMLTRRMGLR
jgi:glycosyltransferase involved in cell wall biosynthesis